MKLDFGFRVCDVIAEACYRQSVAYSPYITEFDAVECWVNSPKHYQLLIDRDIDVGAVACYNEYCVFIGVDLCS